MDVIVYTRPGDEGSRRIKEILADRGVAFREMNLDKDDVPLTVIDGVPIRGVQQAQIEQAIGWIGF